MNSPKKTVIADWLTSYLANLLEINPAGIEIDCAFDELGLDSTAAACLSGDLSDWLKIELEPELAFRYNSVEILSAHLAGQMSRADGN
jgi:acyl carrier protein